MSSSKTKMTLQASIFATASSPYALVSGTMGYSTPANESISIPSKTKVGDKPRPVFNDQRQYDNFKHFASSAPAVNVVTVQDAHQNILAKFLSGRSSNKTAGTVQYTSKPAYFLNELSFSTDTDEEVVIVLDNYQPFLNCYSSESKEFVIREDFKLFSEKYDLSKVTMFVTQYVASLLTTYKLDQMFKAVHVAHNDKLAQTLCEHLFGAVLSGSEPSFQGFLNFGPTTDIVYAKFTNKEQGKTKKVTETVRTSGRLQLNLDGAEGTYNFIIVIKTPEMLDQIVESETKSVFPLDNAITERLTCFDEGILAHLVDKFRFCHMMETTSVEKREQLLKDHSDKVIDQLFVKKNTLKTMFEPFGTQFEKTDPLNDNYLLVKFALETDTAIQTNLTKFMRVGNYDPYHPLPTMGLGLHPTPSEGPFCERQYSCAAAPSFSYSTNP
jgi:hypothetical protein